MFTNGPFRLSAAEAEKAKWEDELTGLSVTPAGQQLMEPRNALRYAFES